VEFENGVDELVGEVVFGCEGKILDMILIDEGDLVIVGVEADAGL
jgi:hypothetical protein